MTSVFRGARAGALGLGALFALTPTLAHAQDALDSGDTAWLLTATALVLFMTLPGLALFYAGLVRAQNIVSVLIQCFAIACVASVLWLLVGYSIAFGDGGATNAWWGGLDKALLWGAGTDALAGTAPETVFMMFQMTFAIITPALIVGAYAERVGFGFVVVFSGVWLLLVYAPVTHWVWGGGWLAEMGVRDFAGGIVVHLTCGISALVLAIMIGARQGFPSDLKPPHNPGQTMIGASMLWVGWFGFNAGSALAADGAAGMAMLVTHIAAATASLTWMTIEWVKFGKPSVVGIVTGMVAGLATITPASGFVGPLGALIIGVAAGAICQGMTLMIKQRLRIDDSLDVFAVHGVGGILGSLLLCVLAAPSFGGLGLDMSVGGHFGAQITAIVAVAAWTAVLTFVIAKVVGLITPARVDPEVEVEGLDLRVHGERGYDL